LKGLSPFKLPSPSPLKERGIKVVRLINNLTTWRDMSHDNC